MQKAWIRTNQPIGKVHAVVQLTQPSDSARHLDRYAVRLGSETNAVSITTLSIPT
jgi:hypothetical protein